MNDFRAILPHEDGILLQPHIRKKLKLSRQKKASQSIKSLPLPSRKKTRHYIQKQGWQKGTEPKKGKMYSLWT